MTEQLANLAYSTLVATITSSQTTLQVASAASFSTTGSFRLLVDSELMQVTAVSGTTFTVIRGAEGTTAASHTAGVTVAQVITAAGLQAAFDPAGSVTSGVTGTGFWYSTAGALNAASVTFGGDISAGALSGGSVPLTVKSISGTSPIAITPASLQWTATTSAPTLTQATRTSDVATSSTTVSAQSAFATATTNTTGANLNLAAGAGASSNATYTSGSVNLQVNAPNSGGTEAYVNVQRAGTTLVAMGALVGTTSQGAIYGPGTPSASNFMLSGDGSSLTVLNAPSGGTVRINVGASTLYTFTASLASFSEPVAGRSGNNAFAWSSVSQALTSGSSNVLANTVYNSPRIKFTGTLTGTGTTITFPATEGAFWICDFDGVTFGGNTIALNANGNTWGTTISALTTVVLIYYIASEGKLYGVSLSA